MRTLTHFLLTTLLGGLLVLAPLLLIYLMIDELFELVVVLGTPISELFPDSPIALLSDPFWISLVLLVLLAFICGLALYSSTLRNLGGWIEARTLGRLAVYRAIKGMAHGMLGSKGRHRFTPALWSYNEHCRQLVYLIEGGLPAAPNTELTILIPDAPGGFSGSVMRVDVSQLQPLDASLGEVSGVLAQWGVGTAELMDRSAAAK